MKVLIQRVNCASVAVDEKIISSIERGLLLLVGIAQGDSEKILKPMAEKIVNLRIFSDERMRFNYSLNDIKGDILLVPQFTLFADTSKGRRPEFFGAEKPEKAAAMFNLFVECFKTLGIQNVGKGEFGAYMKVVLENDGPVTIMIES